MLFDHFVALNLEYAERFKSRIENEVHHLKIIDFIFIRFIILMLNIFSMESRIKSVSDETRRSRARREW